MRVTTGDVFPLVPENVVFSNSQIDRGIPSFFILVATRACPGAGYKDGGGSTLSVLLLTNALAACNLAT